MSAMRGRAVAELLCDGLDATTAYREPETPRSTRPPKWEQMYGWHLQIQAADNAILDSSGKPSKLSVKQAWSHNPGDIIDSGAKQRTTDPGRKYMVQPDRSLRLI